MDADAFRLDAVSSHRITPAHGSPSGSIRNSSSSIRNNSSSIRNNSSSIGPRPRPTSTYSARATPRRRTARWWARSSAPATLAPPQPQPPKRPQSTSAQPQRILLYTGTPRAALYAPTFSALWSELSPVAEGILSKTKLISVQDPTPSEVHEIADIFGIHALTAADIIGATATARRDKLDVFPTYTYISFEPAADAATIAPRTHLVVHPSAPRLSLLVFGDLVLAFHSFSAGPVKARLDSSATLSAGYVVYAFVDYAADTISPRAAQLESNVDACDELVLLLSHNEQDDMLGRLGGLRRDALDLWRISSLKPQILESLIAAFPASARLLADTLGHVCAIVASCEMSDSILSRAHSNYLAKISLELTRASLDANATTERWTVLGAIVVPINLVTGLFGMNVKVPGQDRDDALNFSVIIVCSAVFSVIVLCWAKRSL